MIAPFVKLASERFGYRSVAISGVVSTSAGVFMTSFLSSLIPMFATFGVMAGIGAGLFTVCAFDLIVLYFPERNTMRAVAIASTGSTTGMLAFSQIMALLLRKYGWRITLRVMGGLLFTVGLPSVMTYIVPSRLHSNKDNENEDCKMVPRDKTSSTAKAPLHENSRRLLDQSHDSARDASIGDQVQCTSDSKAYRTEEGLGEDVDSLLEDGEIISDDTEVVAEISDIGEMPVRGSEYTEDDLVNPDSEIALLDNKEQSESLMNFNAPSQTASTASKMDPLISAYEFEENIIPEDQSVMKTESAFQLNSLSYNNHDNGDTYKNLSILEDGDNVMTRSELAEEDHQDPRMLWKIGRALTFPELWMVAISNILNGIGDCFYYINVISYLMSIGFEEETGVQFVSFTALSSLVCKVLLVLVGEYVPFPRIFLQVFANFISILALIAFMLVTNVVPVLCIAIAAGMTMAISNVVIFSLAPDLFGAKKAIETSAVLYLSYGSGFLLGSLVGQSIDKTGSYTSALFAFIGIFVTSGILLLMAPLYQRLFAPERFVTFDLHRRKREARSKNRKSVKDQGENRENSDKQG
ncbi:uncharacterized protein LOC105442193 [Strongylocentrotus purpuratus]|uniref:Uncharacterized protein n=1 Tax=Strongylocentrotus purpuratus TaxID=7668 RepID=A0A7M7NPP5_STRPU|nr:uncharacterized protein LOC105442193 [Strongylocentrotus purpuratus]